MTDETDTIEDPGEPGEPTTYLKAKDLPGFACIFIPRTTGEWPAKEEIKDDAGVVTQKKQGPQPYVECTVHTFDRAGLLESSEGVKVSWVRVYPQLEDKTNRYVAARPEKQDDNSIILTPLDEEHKAVARKIVEDLKAAIDPDAEPF